METPRHLRQKILHGTFALFPLIDTCWNQFGYIVSTFSPCGLDLATLFLVPFRMESCKKRCFYPYAQWICHFVGCFLPFFMPFDRRNDVFSKISVRKWHILICFLYFCRVFAIKAIADIIKGVNYALYIGHSKLPQSESPVDGIAEKMSGVSCIINPRSVPRRANLQRHTTRHI